MKKIMFFAALILFVIAVSQTKADRRFYGWTYQYQTMEAGAAELEYYNTISSSNAKDFRGVTSTEHKVEFEVGMNEHFDFAIYQIFNQSPGEALRYEGFQLRERFRFGEKGKWFVDPVAYLEYSGVPDFTKHSLEAKLILAKDFSKFNIALNPFIEFEKDKEFETIPGISLGMSYEILPILRLGAEVMTDKEGTYIAPTISHGLGGLFVVASPAFVIGKVDAGRPEFMFRLLVGVNLK